LRKNAWANGGWPLFAGGRRDDIVLRRLGTDYLDLCQIHRYDPDTDLDEIEMALAFVLRHPAVTAAIIGPRTMEHLESQLTAADTVLSSDVLDQVDEIVPPGITLNPADNGWVSPALEATARRR